MIIPFILEKAVSLYPHKEAVVCGDRRFTYKQFGDRAYALASAFHGMGIRKGDRIAILHPNGHQYLETYFAAALLGVILNPLNVRLSPKELAFILMDSGARFLIAAPRYKDSVNAVMMLDTYITDIIWTGTQPEKNAFKSLEYEDLVYSNQDNSKMPDVSIFDDDVAHLYYTSGTTGRPKGVMLSHKNVCTHALAAIAELRLGDHDHWIHVAPLFHLADAWATFAVTWAGGKHILMPDFDPPLILSTIQKEKITITNMVPTMLNTLIHTNGVESFDFSSLRVILSGGAPIAPELVKRIMETFRCDYVQTYGMTETSPYLTVSILKEHLRNLPQEEQFQYKSKTGRPFLGILLKVVREDGAEVNADDKEVGEIIVKGDIVTQGYWNRPKETAEAIKDGWLHTGDMAIVDQEGYVNIVDRKKDVIITGGENVYSIEVENILYSHPAVLEAVVVGLPDPKWGESVKAVIVLKPGCIACEEEIIQHCRANIAGFKTPKSIDFFTELPRTGSGKIHKKKIREMFQSPGD